MNGEVAALYAVVEAGKDADFLFVRGEGFQEVRCVEIGAGPFGKEKWGVEAEGVAVVVTLLSALSGVCAKIAGANINIGKAVKSMKDRRLTIGAPFVSSFTL